MENDPIKEYFMPSGKARPTLEEMRKIFPNLLIKEDRRSFILFASASGSKSIEFSFDQKEIVIELLRSYERGRIKLIESVEEFENIKPTLIKFLHWDVKKVPEINSWNDVYDRNLHRYVKAK